MPNERILYILGAGFSAPLGLPLMNNFIFKAKDQYALDPERYKHFADVFRLVDEMAKVKNFYSSDLFNIEEVLSILEMQSEVSGNNHRELFVRFICDTVSNYTPSFTTGVDCTASNYDDQLIDQSGSIGPYINFVASLFKAKLILHVKTTGQGNRGRFSIEANSTSDLRYSVVTLNYDTVLEACCAFLTDNAEGSLNFADERSAPDPQWQRGPYLAKLHGSVSTGTIVPPTWSKGVTDEIRAAWRLAHELLAEATAIRIVGYSMAPADTYVKYLLKSAALQSDRLKAIDVLCLDGDGLTKQRYDEFFAFPNYHFIADNVATHLFSLMKLGRTSGQSPDRKEFGSLEHAHRRLLDRI